MNAQTSLNHNGVDLVDIANFTDNAADNAYRVVDLATGRTVASFEGISSTEVTFSGGSFGQVAEAGNLIIEFDPLFGFNVIPDFNAPGNILSAGQFSLSRDNIAQYLGALGNQRADGPLLGVADLFDRMEVANGPFGSSAITIPFHPHHRVPRAFPAILTG